MMQKIPKLTTKSLWVTSAIVLVGLFLLGMSGASTRIAHIQLSEGEVSGGRGLINDSSSSEGQVLQFGINQPSPTIPTTTPVVLPTAPPTSTASPHPSPGQGVYDVSIIRRTEISQTLFSHISDTYFYTDSAKKIRRAWTTFKIAPDNQTAGFYYAFHAFLDGDGCKGDTDNNINVNSCMAYMGLQINAYTGVAAYPTADKMAIFSVWDATENITPDEGWSVTFGGEGRGKSNRSVISWVPDREYVLYIGQDDLRTNSSEVWWESSVYDKVTGKIYSLGSIRLVSGSTAATSMAVFHETFTQEKSNCNEVETSVLTVSDTKYEFTDGTIAKPNKRDHYLRNVSEECKKLFTVIDDPKGDTFSSIVNLKL